jgi:hypothetical protein
MVPHYSGTTLDAQKRYAEGVRDILERYFAGKEQEPQNLIVHGGAYATNACEYLFQSRRYQGITRLRWSTLNLEAFRTNVALSNRTIVRYPIEMLKILLNLQSQPRVQSTNQYNALETAV